MVGQDKPDTYVKVKSGAEEKVTSVVKNSADPTWDEPQWYKTNIGPFLNTMTINLNEISLGFTS